jgi:hypothetical protein
MCTPSCDASVCAFAPPVDHDNDDACSQERMVSGAVFINPQGPYKNLTELWDDDHDDADV